MHPTPNIVWKLLPHEEVYSVHSISVTLPPPHKQYASVVSLLSVCLLCIVTGSFQCNESFRNNNFCTTFSKTLSPPLEVDACLLSTVWCSVSLCVILQINSHLIKSNKTRTHSVIRSFFGCRMHRFGTVARGWGERGGGWKRYFFGVCRPAFSKTDVLRWVNYSDLTLHAIEKKRESYGNK